MSTLSTTTLIDELRRRIRDVHPSVQCLTIGVQGNGITSAKLEITNQRMIFVGSGGGIRPFDVDLTSPLNQTVGLLHDSIQRMTGMVSAMDNQADPTHLAMDLESFGPRDVLGQGTILRHRVFSDPELIRVLESALRRHNPSLTIYNLPPAEFELTLTLAQAMIARELAGDTIKRKNTAETVESLLSIAASHEQVYERDNRRLARVIQSPKEGNANGTGRGDVMMGTMVRRSLRTGLMTPMAGSSPVAPPNLYPPSDDDDQDDNVRVRWDRSPDTNLLRYELWMDSHANVIRSARVGREARGILIQNRDQEVRDTSSVFLGSVEGESMASASPVFSTYILGGGTMVTSVVVGLLEPETSYFFRVFAVSINGEASASEVVEHTTRHRRARLAKTNPVLPGLGPAGTLVTLRFDPDWSPFTVNHRLTVGGKVVIPTIVTGYQITFLVPSFVQKGMKDIVVTSPDGQLTSVLRDRLRVA